MSQGSDITPAHNQVDLSKVVRLQTMLERLRAEIREINADAASLTRLAAVHNEIESQLISAVPADLGAELAEFSACCREEANPSKPEIRVAQAQLIGWIEGLLRGVQVSINAAGSTGQNAPTVADDSAEGGGHNPNLYL